MELLAGATSMIRHLELADMATYLQAAIDITSDKQKLAAARRQLALIEAARAYLRTVALIDDAPL